MPAGAAILKGSLITLHAPNAIKKIKMLSTNRKLFKSLLSTSSPPVSLFK